MRTATSTTLLEGLQDPRNDRAWQRFYARYTPMLLSYGQRVGLSDSDVQDVVAETLATFVQAYQAGRYDRNRGRLKSWLGGIIQNKVRKLLNRRRSAPLDPRLEDPAVPNEQDEAFEHEWRLERLSAALDVLRRESEPTTYQAFDLYALKAWPATKVAPFLNMTANAVYISKTRMLKRLREIVAQLEAEED